MVRQGPGRTRCNPANVALGGPAHSLLKPAKARTLANSQGPVAAVSLAEAARFWARLGMVSFGGPAAQIALLLWLHQSLAWSWLNCALAVAGLDLALSGLFLRIGGGAVFSAAHH